MKALFVTGSGEALEVFEREHQGTAVSDVRKSNPCRTCGLGWWREEGVSASRVVRRGLSSPSFLLSFLSLVKHFTGITWQ